MACEKALGVKQEAWRTAHRDCGGKERTWLVDEQAGKGLSAVSKGSDYSLRAPEVLWVWFFFFQLKFLLR